MLNFFKSIIVLIFMPACILAQVGTAIPNWVKPVKFAGTSVNKKLVKDGYYYVLVDEQYNTLKKHVYCRYALSAITEEALTNVSQLEFKFDPSYQKAVLHKVIVHRNGVATDRTKTIELKQLDEESRRNEGVLTGMKTLYANLSDIRKNDVVEYSYSIVGENPVMKDHFDFNMYLSYGVPVGKIYLRVISAKGVDLDIVSKNTEQKPVITETDVRDYEWEVIDPPVINQEGSTPSWYSSYASVQISDLHSWKDVKDHCRPLFLLTKYDQEELRFIVDSIVNASQDVEVRITSIIEFVQTHIRYSGNENGIYSHVPRTPDFVLKHRYGDCKEKSVLLNEMLKMIGIVAYPVLINSYRGQKITENVPAINAFDHCISCFQYKGQLIFIDPTISSQRGHFKFRTVPNYETGMILDESETPFTKIPSDLSSHCSVSEEFIIEKSGSARLKVKTVYTGTEADEMRYYFLIKSIYDVQDSYKTFYSKFGENIIVLDTVRYEDNENINEFTTYEDYMFPEFWVPKDSTKNKIVSKDFIPYALNQRLNYGEELHRREPMYLNYPVSHSHTIIVAKEGGWNVEESLKKEDNKLFSYTYLIKVKGDKLLLNYAYFSKTNVVMPKDYDEYKKGMDYVSNNMVFSCEERPHADGIIGFNWPLLLVLIIGGAAGIFATWKLSQQKINTMFETQYNSLGGWLIVLAFSVSLTPISLLIGTFKQYWGEWGVNYFEFFFNERSSFFSPLRGYYNFFIPFFNMLFLVYSFYITFVFYKRKNSFRMNFCVFRISHTLFLILNVIVLHIIYSGSTIVEERIVLSGQITAMVRSIIGTCIWVPYVWYSERSKHTFTIGNYEISADLNGANDQASSSSQQLK